MRAVVLDERRALAVRDDVRTAPLGPRDVQVRVRAASLCHSDLHALDGRVPTPLPLVLGHEAAGEVTAAGPGVTRVQPGDAVVLSMVPICGRCRRCLGGQPNLCLEVDALRAPVRFTLDGHPAHGFLGLGTLAERLVVPEASVVRVPGDVPFDLLALLGCGVTTGVGAALRSARVAPGESVVVFGCGAVGLGVLQGAALAGARLTLAVDPVPAKREVALRLGATHAADPAEAPALAATLTGEGFDHAFDAVGSPAAVRAAWEAARRGGSVTTIGGAPGEQVSFDARDLFFAEKTLRGTVYGSVDARRDIPAFVDLWRAGRLDLAAMVSAHLTLDEVGPALERLRQAKVIREVVLL